MGDARPSVDVRVHNWPGPTVDVGPSIARPTVDPQLPPNTSHLDLTNFSRSSFKNSVRIGSKKSTTCTWPHVRNSSIDGSTSRVEEEEAAEYRFVGVATSFPWSRFGGGTSSCTAASSLWSVSGQYSLYLIHKTLTYVSNSSLHFF